MLHTKTPPHCSQPTSSDDCSVFAQSLHEAALALEVGVAQAVLERCLAIEAGALMARGGAHVVTSYIGGGESRRTFALGTGTAVTHTSPAAVSQWFHLIFLKVFLC